MKGQNVMISFFVWAKLKAYAAQLAIKTGTRTNLKQIVSDAVEHYINGDKNGTS